MHPYFSYFQNTAARLVLLFNTFTSLPKMKLIQLAVSPKCLLDISVCHLVPKMPYLTDKSAVFREKVQINLLQTHFIYTTPELPVH